MCLFFHRSDKMNQMKDRDIVVIDDRLCDRVSAEAGIHPRLRMNFNFHRDTDDLLNRLLNAVEPGTYVRPHRHLNPDKEEVTLVLRGAVSCFVFDDRGEVLRRVDLNPENGRYGMEIAAGLWHSLVVTAPHTVLYEVKRGPYVPVSSVGFARWAPDGSDPDAVWKFQKQLMLFPAESE